MTTYLQQMIGDVQTAIYDDYDRHDWIGDREGFEETLNDDLWTDDAVTGNASGSYWFNSEYAKNMVLDNIDDVKAAYEEFCIKDEFAEQVFNDEWEAIDVTTRCYLLGQAIGMALDQIEDEGYFDDDDNDEMTA